MPSWSGTYRAPNRELETWLAGFAAANRVAASSGRPAQPWDAPIPPAPPGAAFVSAPFDYDTARTPPAPQLTGSDAAWALAKKRKDVNEAVGKYSDPFGIAQAPLPGDARR